MPTVAKLAPRQKSYAGTSAAAAATRSVECSVRVINFAVSCVIAQFVAQSDMHTAWTLTLHELLQAYLCAMPRATGFQPLLQLIIYGKINGKKKCR